MDSSFRAIVIFLLGWLGTGPIYAHESGLSVIEVRARDDALELTASYALADIQKMLPPSVRIGTDTSQATIDAAQTVLDELASLIWDVRVDGSSLAPRHVRFEFTPSDNLSFRFTFPRPAEGVVVFRSANLASLPSTHRELFTVIDDHGRIRVVHTLTSMDSTARVSLLEIANDPTAPRADPMPRAPVAVGSVFSEFFELGVTHIWTGYDHLLFLFGLLLVCRSFRSIVIIITCFTLAHSITLGLATLDLVSIPAWLVEPLIAASIVFVGVENLFSREAEPHGRGWLTFGFGLVHGFGFSSVLRDLGIGAQGSGIGLPLLSFNLGVEFGQLCVALVVLPVLALVFCSDRSRRFGVPAGSALVAAAGLYWLIERTLLS